MPHILLNLCICMLTGCVCRCVFSVHTLYPIFDAFGYAFLESIRLYSRDTDVEIPTHSQDFLYLNTVANSVELAQDSILSFNIRGNLENPPRPILILMATMSLPSEVVSDSSDCICGSLVIRDLSYFIKEGFSEHFEVPDSLISVFCPPGIKLQFHSRD